MYSLSASITLMVADLAVISILGVFILLPALATHYNKSIAKWLSYISIIVLSAYLVIIPLRFSENLISQPILLIATFAAIINSFRVATGINPANYIKHQASKTSYYSLLLLISSLFLNLLYASEYRPDDNSIELIYSFIAFSACLMLLVMVVRSLIKKPVLKGHSKKEQPSVTVAIPARNEDAVLEKNLHELLESTYPKIEIIVVDDCSHDSTAQIIKSFAHRGVRFISGQQLGDDWLGKNYAYQQLLEEASGEYVLFLGADVSISKEAIGELVSRMNRNQLKMLCVLPRYESKAINLGLLEIAQQVARYLWQIGILRLITRTPAVVGSCMIIERATLEEYGGFKALRHMVEPERFYATKLYETNQYQFITSRDLISDIVSSKDGKGQMYRTIRVAYPLLHRDIISTFLAGMAIILFLLIPISALLLSPFLIPVDNAILGFLIGGGIAAYISYVLVFMYVAPSYVWLSIIMLPITTIQYLVFMGWSLIGYEFLGVEWKGRNVCIPVLDLRFKPAPKRRRGRRSRQARRRRRNQGR